MYLYCAFSRIELARIGKEVDTIAVEVQRLLI
jgi:hypothetical protein